MKKLLSSLIIFSVLFSLNSIANEVGNQNFVLDPKAAPVFVSKGGTKYWPCNGMVNNQLIDIIFNEMTSIASAEGISPPQKNLCYWKRGVFNFGGNSIQTYTVQFYIDSNAFHACTRLDNCQEIRAADFKVSNNQVVRQYMLTSAPRRLTRFACVSMKGDVINLKSGC